MRLNGSSPGLRRSQAARRGNDTAATTTATTITAQAQHQPRDRAGGAQRQACEQFTTSDGMTLNFDQQPTEANNPWLADIEKQTKQ